MKKTPWNLNQFFSLFPGHLYMIDIKGHYQFCNDLQAKDFGFDCAKAVIGKTNYEIPVFKDNASIIQLIENNNKKVFNETKPFEFYEPYHKFDGSFSYCKSYKIPIFENEILIGLIGISFDLSDEAEQIGLLTQKVHQTELTLSNIIDNLPEHIYWLDKNNHFLGCNAVQAKDFGLKNSFEVVGLHVSSFQTKENAHILLENNNKILKEGISLSVEETFQNSQGENMFYLSRKVPLKNNNNEIIGIVGISVDITEQKKFLEGSLRKAKEGAEAGNVAKTEFLANMRHDIRTPLSGIVGFSEIIKLESKEERIKEYADNLIASSHALLDLMDEVLEAVKVSSGEIPALKRKFNLKKTFQQVIALHCAKANEKGLKLILNVDSNLPQFVIGDKIRLHRIALELVGNALNFTDVGQVTLSIELAKKDNRDLVIKILVTDTGMGIPKDKQQDIYIQFKRLTPSYQGIYKGVGLGLYVVKQFIDELEGEIYVESELRKGTCFTCLIPLQAPLLDDGLGTENNENLHEEKRHLTPVTHFSPVLAEEGSSKITNVLVVEDNALAQKVVRTLLASMSCKVDVASNGEAAIILCKKNKYDLILMDIGLGEGMDGYEVTHHIRKQENDHYAPIIALTAHASEDSKQRCIEAGMNAVFAKPLTQAHAADILKVFIPSRQTELTIIPKPLRQDLPDTNDELFQLEQFLLFDREEALKNCGNKSMVIELLTVMITKDMPHDLECMKSAYANKDYSLIEKTVHKIKSSALYVGTIRMKYACQYLERYRKTGEGDLLEPLYHQAISVIEETCDYIIKWLNEQQKS